MEVFLSVTGIIIILAMVILAFILWKVAKLLLIPIQILLFLALLFIAYKLLWTPERAKMISDKDTQEKIQGLVNKASDSAIRFVKDAGKKHLADKLRNDTDQSGKDTPNAAEGKGPAETEHVGNGKENQ